MFSLLKATFQEFARDRCPRMAAALAFYTVFSLPPLLVLIVTISSYISDSANVQDRFEAQAAEVVGEDSAKQLGSVLTQATFDRQNLVASGVNLFLLVFASTGLVGHLQTSLNDAWKVRRDPKRNPVRRVFIKRILSFALIFGVAVLLLTSLMVHTLIAAAGDAVDDLLPDAISETFLRSMNFVIPLGAVTVLFAAIFKFLPDAKIWWADVVVGALLTSALFAAGNFLLAIYLSKRGTPSFYGATSSLTAILIWIYCSAMVFLFGAEFTQVWATRRGRGVRPRRGSVRMHESPRRVPPSDKNNAS